MFFVQIWGPVTEIKLFHYRVRRPVNTTLSDVHYQARILVGVDVDHVSQGTVCDGRTEDWDVVLKVKSQDTIKVVA